VGGGPGRAAEPPWRWAGGPAGRSRGRQGVPAGSGVEAGGEHPAGADGDHRRSARADQVHPESGGGQGDGHCAGGQQFEDAEAADDTLQRLVAPPQAGRFD
jgi:hypothetical protein